MEHNLDTPEEEIIRTCQSMINSTHQTLNELKLNYYLGVLSIKQQKKLLAEQNLFNKKLLRTNLWLVIATWALALATVVLVFVSK